MTESFDTRIQRAIERVPGNLGRLDVPPTLVIERGDGALVWDVDGNEYVDCLMGSGPLILGHAHPAWNEAMKEQLDRGTTFITWNPQAMELSEILIDAIPCAEAIKYTNTGSEAIMYALRFARAATGRNKILKFEGGYHGHGEYAVFSYASRANEPYPAAVAEGLGVTPGVKQDVLVAPYNDLDTAGAILDAHAGEVACIVVEPVQRSIMPEPGFLAGLRRLADEHGALLLFDEIVTGFRLAWGGAQEYFGVTPDLATYGKAMAGGYPIAVVAGRADVLAYANPKNADGKIHFSGTFNGHALGATAALATLQILREPGTYERLAAIGKQLEESVNAVLATHGLEGFLLAGNSWFELILGATEVRDHAGYLATDRQRAVAINQVVMEQGILLNTTAKSYLSLAHHEDIVDRVSSAFESAIRAHAPVAAGVSA